MRWGAIIAGLFGALTTLVVLAVIGTAVGLSSTDASGNNANAFGIAAGIWGAISALIAFGIGAWLAARTGALQGNGPGILNGGMVFVVAIPLLLWGLGSGISSAFGAAGHVASMGVRSDAAADNRTDQRQNAPAGEPAIDRATTAARNAVDQITPQQAANAANSAGTAAWWTLLALGLGAAASLAGGYAGAKARAGHPLRVAVS